jgi:hypothetical protein
MQRPKTKRRIPSFGERLCEVEELRYLLLHEGLTQQQAAAQIGRSQKTVCFWVKQFRIREELQKQKGKKSVRSLQMENSLPAFVAYLRIHHKDLFKQLQPVLEEFSQPS